MLRQNKLAMAGLVFLSFLVIMAIIGPSLSPNPIEKQSIMNQNILHLNIGLAQMILAEMYLREPGMVPVSLYL